MEITENQIVIEEMTEEEKKRFQTALEETRQLDWERSPRKSLNTISGQTAKIVINW